MIFSDPSQAYDYAESWAHALIALENLSDGTYRVVLDPQEAAMVPPGKLVPETAPLPPGVLIVSQVRPELPDHIAKVERQLATVRISDGKGGSVGKYFPMTDTWVKTIGRSYMFPKKNIVVRAGRRGGKSSTLSRVVLAEILWGDHAIPGGSVGTFALIAQDRDKSKDRVDAIDEMCKDLGISHKATATKIEFPKIPNRDIRVFTASVAGISGVNCIGILADEVAKWKDPDKNVNPGDEVIKSARPTMATFPNAKMWLVSSPYSTGDAHYEEFEQGTSHARTVFYFPSWVGNPTLDPDETLEMDCTGDRQTWEREYLAIPMATGESAFFSSDQIEEATKLDLEIRDPVFRAGGDLAFRKNSTALVIIAAGRDAKGRDTFGLISDREWVPTSKSLRPTEVTRAILGDAKAAGCESLCCDLHYVEMVREALEGSAIALIEFPTSQQGKTAAYMRVRQLLSEGRLDLTRASRDLVRQFGETIVNATASGLAIENPELGGKHGDILDALVCAIYGFTRGGIPGGGGSRRFARGGDVPTTAKWNEYAGDKWSDVDDT